MGYLDTTDAEIIALTREHRAAAKAKRDEARQAHEAQAFPFLPLHVLEPIEASWRDHDDQWGRHPVHIQWKRDQWESGNHHCGYCGVRMCRLPNLPRTCTVDHRKPRALGGKDVPENWLLACYDCNQRKGTMSESAFRAIIAFEKRCSGGRLTA